MRTVRDLVANENLGKLIAAQRSFDKAANMFNEVFNEEGAPCDVEPVQEEFFNSLADCEKKLERLIGTVVYHDLFPPNVEPAISKRATSYTYMQKSEQYT